MIRTIGTVSLCMVLVTWVGMDMAAAKTSTPSIRKVQSAPELGDSIPLYKPRKDSTPRGRVDGGFRGGDKGEPVLRVLAPDHVGFTVKGEPPLYWYLSKETSLPVEFTLVDTRAIPPIVETSLSSPAHAGVQKVWLKDLGKSLEPGVQYLWSVSLIPDPESRSRDIMARGTIERIPFDEALMLDLVKPCKRETIYVFAEKGVWYDAIACVCELIDANPHDPALRKLRAALLKQIDLNDVAEHDLKQNGAK
jgi:Domain of Unknown Function (DUF928)